MRLLFAGTPAAAVPSLEALLALPPRGGRRAHAPRRPLRPGPVLRAERGQGARPGGRARGPHPAAPAGRGLPGAARGARGRRGARRRLRRPDPAVAAGRPDPRLGQPALLGAAGLARRRARCSTRSSPATRCRAPRRSGSRRAWTPGRCSGSSPRRSARGTRPGTCSGAWRWPGAGLLVQTLDALEDGILSPVVQATDGVSLAPKIEVEDARVRWSHPAHAVDRRVRGCTPAPGAWTTLPDGSRLGLAPVVPVAGRHRPGAGAAAGRQEGGARRDRRARGPADRGDPAGQAGDGRGGLGARRAARVRHRARRCGMSPADDRRDPSGRQRGAARSQGRTQRSAVRTVAAPAGERRRRGRRPTTSCAPSTAPTRTPTSSCRPCCASAGSPAGTRRSPPSSPTARCGCAAATTRSSPWRPTARSSTHRRARARRPAARRPPAARHAGARARGGVRDGRPRPRAAGHRSVAVRQRRAAHRRAVDAGGVGPSGSAAAAGDDELARRSRRSQSHPLWVVRALREALVGNGRPADEIAALLAADNVAPRVTIVARPGLADADEVVEDAGDGVGDGRRAGARRRSSCRAATRRRCRACATAGRGCRTRAASWSRSP